MTLKALRGGLAVATNSKRSNDNEWVLTHTSGIRPSLAENEGERAPRQKAAAERREHSTRVSPRHFPLFGFESLRPPPFGLLHSHRCTRHKPALSPRPRICCFILEYKFREESPSGNKDSDTLH
jgi:hypothetical protein